jgi:hypothetical protein
MEVDRFDAFVRSLGSSSSRRTTLRALFAGAVAGSVGLLGWEKAAACKPLGGKCAKTSQCCSGKCKKKGKKTGRCASNSSGCPSGQQPCSGGCIPLDQCCGGCPQEQTCCSFADGGQCLDLFNDNNHCGHCQNGQCPGASFCLHAHCADACTTPAGVGCPGGCTCLARVGHGGNACGFDSFLDCNNLNSDDICSNDDDCGFAEGCFAACPGVSGVCLQPCF